MRTPRWFHVPTTAHVGGDLFHVVETLAAEWTPFLDAALPFDRKAFAARRALDEDPGCIEAHLFLAHHTDDDDLARLHLAKAAATGEALWAPVAARASRFRLVARDRDAPVHAGHQGGGRPSRRWGHEVGARQFYDALLRMNPGDNQGVGPLVASHSEAEEHAVAPRM